MNAESLALAKISLLVSLTNGSFGLAVINDQLMMVEGAFLITLNLQPSKVSPPPYQFSTYNV